MLLRFTILCIIAALSGIAPAHAAAPNTPELDGRLIEYDSAEQRGVFTGAPTWPGMAISNLYVTWDATNLYVSLSCRMGSDKIAILLDVDPGNGTGATTTTNWVNGTNVLFIYNDPGWRKSDHPGATPFGLDFMIATEGFYNSLALVLYNGVQVPNTNIAKRMFDLPDTGNGNIPLDTPIEVVTLKDNTTNSVKGLEARIPWSVVYGGNTNRFGFVAPGKTVPTGATVRLFANIHNNLSNSSFSSPDTIPAQTSTNASYNATTGLLITDDYLDVVIDGNLDGLPDLAPADANAPYLTKLIGIAGSTTITGVFNEAVNEASATIVSNWTISGATIASIDMLAPNRVALHVAAPLPAAGTLIPVQTLGVEDLFGNDRVAQNLLTTRAGPYLSSYTSMTAVGTFQGWAPEANNMVRVDDYTWQYDVAILASTGIAFKIAANGSWTINFGRPSFYASSVPLVDKAGTPNGSDIAVTNLFNGTYRFIFNEQTRAVALAKAGTDTDADGLPDVWEITYALSPTNAGAATDQDGDFVNNREEYLADTHPRDVGSYLFIRSMTHQTAGTEITFPSSTNRLYIIDSAETASGSWSTPPAPPVAATGAVTTLSSTNIAAAAVYRIRAQTP